METRFQTMTAEEYKNQLYGYMECHMTDCIQSATYNDGSEKYVFLQSSELIIFSKNRTENDFTYTISVRELC